MGYWPGRRRVDTVATEAGREGEGAGEGLWWFVCPVALLVHHVGREVCTQPNTITDTLLGKLVETL